MAADQEEAEFITIEDPLINIPALLIAYEIPPLVSDDFPALNLLSRILSVGDSSRLAKRLVDTGKALQADALVIDNRGPGIYSPLFLSPTLGLNCRSLRREPMKNSKRSLKRAFRKKNLTK